MTLHFFLCTVFSLVMCESLAAEIEMVGMDSVMIVRGKGSRAASYDVLSFSVGAVAFLGDKNV